MSTLEKPYGRRDRPGYRHTRLTRHPRRAARRARAGEHPQLQQRFVLKTFPDFPSAHKAKQGMIKEFPDDTYQIRKKGDGFALVKRFNINQIKSAQLADKKGKSRGKN